MDRDVDDESGDDESGDAGGANANDAIDLAQEEESGNDVPPVNRNSGGRNVDHAWAWFCADSKDRMLKRSNCGNCKCNVNHANALSKTVEEVEQVLDIVVDDDADDDEINEVGWSEDGELEEVEEVEEEHVEDE
jgi:Barwin family